MIDRGPGSYIPESGAASLATFDSGRSVLQYIVWFAWPLFLLNYYYYSDLPRKTQI